jgi:hypothetical protein
MGTLGASKEGIFQSIWGYPENQHFLSISLEIVIWNVGWELWDLNNQKTIGNIL